VPKKLKTFELCLDAIGEEYVSENPIDKAFHRIGDLTSSLDSPFLYVPLKFLTAEFYFEAVKRNSEALDWVPPNLKTPELCLEAVKRNSEALKYVPEYIKKVVEDEAKKES